MPSHTRLALAAGDDERELRIRISEPRRVESNPSECGLHATDWSLARRTVWSFAEQRQEAGSLATGERHVSNFRR